MQESTVHPDFIDLLATENEEVENGKLYKMKKAIDCYVLSYPKCGRTWVYAFLQIYMMMHLKRGIQIIGYGAFWPQKTKKPKIAFTHRLIEYRLGAKTIYLLRDPKDVMVSYFFQATRRTGSVPSTTHISDFIRNDKLGMPQLVRYHKKMHELVQQAESALYVRYEDLRSDEMNQWKRILDFVGMGYHEDLAGKVALACSFDNMKRGIKNPQSFFYQHPQQWMFMAIEGNIITNRPDDEESHKMRKGVVGGYVKYLSKNDIDYIDEMAKGIPEEWR